jgi:hypothetical protein
MKQHPGDEAEIRRYLLGELTQEERVTVEARLFLDDDYSSQLEAVEDEMVDEYAYDELPAGEREKFETHFLTRPGRGVDLKVAQALKRFISSEAASDSPPTTAPEAVPPPAEGPFARLASLFSHRPVFGFSLAAAALIVLSIITWLVVVSLRGRNPDRQLQAQQPTPQRTEPNEQRGPESNPPNDNGTSNGGPETAERERGGRGNTERTGRQGTGQTAREAGRHDDSRPPARQPPTQVATVLLLPGGAVRGKGRARSVPLSPNVKTVVLKLPLPDGDEYLSYRATLGTGGRPRAWANLKPEVYEEFGRVVSVPVPAGLLRRQSYRMELSGVTGTGEIRHLTSYTFQVERK